MTFDSRWKNPQGKDLESLWRWAQETIKELRKGDFFSTQVGAGIANAQLADMAAWTIKARNAGTTGEAQDVDRPDLTAASNPVNAHELLGFLSTNDLRRFTTGNVGGLQLLNSGTVTNAATLDIVLTSFTAYRGLKFVLSSFVPATDDVELWMRLSTDGGSTYDAGASDYSWNLSRGRSGSTTFSADNSTGDSKILVAGANAAGFSISNTANEGGADMEIVLLNQTATRFAGVKSTGGYTAGNGETMNIASFGKRLAAQDTDAARFLFESGNIASGNWAVYGYA